jgi:hypothetical protein
VGGVAVSAAILKAEVLRIGTKGLLRSGEIPGWQDFSTARQRTGGSGSFRRNSLCVKMRATLPGNEKRTSMYLFFVVSLN